MKTGIIKVFFFVMVAMTMMVFANRVSAADALSEEAAEEKAGGVKSLEKRIEQLEEAIGRPVTGDKWVDRLQISGLIEVEAWYQMIEFDDPDTDDENSSDVDLTTVELAVDARIVDHVDGHVLFKYEDDDVFVDEGFLTLSGTKSFPAYLIAGRQYIPFGNFDSYFVTDPEHLDFRRDQ